MARDYELALIINPDVGDEQARAIVDRVTQTVAANDGQVVRVNAWGRRRLAYPIEHHRDGLYFFFDLILAPEATTEVERTLRVNEAVLRHLIKVRDPRIAEQQRQRDAEAEAQAAAQAEAQAAAAEAAQAAQAAQPAVAEEAAPEPAPEPAVAEEAAPEPAVAEEAAVPEAIESEELPEAEDEDQDEATEATEATEAQANA